MYVEMARMKGGENASSWNVGSGGRDEASVSRRRDVMSVGAIVSLGRGWGSKHVHRCRERIECLMWSGFVQISTTFDKTASKAKMLWSQLENSFLMVLDTTFSVAFVFLRPSCPARKDARMTLGPLPP